MERNPELGVSWNRKQVRALETTQDNTGSDEFKTTPEVFIAIANTSFTFQSTGVENLKKLVSILQAVNYNPNKDTLSTRRKNFENYLLTRLLKLPNPPLS